MTIDDSKKCGLKLRRDEKSGVIAVIHVLSETENGNELFLRNYDSWFAKKTLTEMETANLDSDEGLLLSKDRLEKLVAENEPGRSPTSSLLRAFYDFCESTMKDDGQNTNV